MGIKSRIDAITLIPQRYRTTVCPAPKSVKIEMTARCDLKCFFCATSQRLRKKGDMNLDFFKSIVKDMRLCGVEEIGMFYLGESMLYPHLGEAISYTKKACKFPYVFLTTNGRKATPDKIDEIIESGLDSLKFSLNACNRDQYKSMCGVDAFDEVIHNIKAARKVRDEIEKRTGHHCGLYCSSIQYDGEQLKMMEDVIETLKPYVDEHYWLPLYGQAGLTAGVRGTKPVAGNIGRIGALRDSLPCWALFTEGHVTFDGKLTGCCFDHNDSFTFGDLKDMPFMSAWNSKVAQDLRRANLNKDVTGTACAKCIAYSS